MASKDLVYRFFGIDAGAGRQFDRMAANAAAGGAAWSKYALAAKVTTAVVAGYAIKTAADFQQSMTKLHTQANVSTHDVGVLSKGILAMAASVAETPNELAQAAYHIASVGQKSLTTAQQLGILRIASEGAKIGGADLVDTTNALDAAIVSGIKGVQNYGQAMGVLNATVGAGDMTMQDLADALSTGVVTAAKTAGLGIKDVGAALAVFGDNNIRGSTAAQRLTRVIMLMQAPSSTAAAALKSIGIGQTQLASDMRKPDGLSAALTDLQAHLRASGKSAVQQSQIIAEAFGRSKGAANVELLLAELDRLNNKYKVLGDGANSFAKSWQSYTKTFSYQFDRMRAEVETVAIKLGTVLIPAATKTVQVIADLGQVIGATVGFFAHNEVAAAGLAAVLGATLLPRLLAVVEEFGAMAALGIESVVRSIGQSFAALGTAAAEAGGGLAGVGTALGAINPLMAAAGAGLFILTKSWQQNQQAQQKAASQAKTFIDSLDVQTNSLSSLRAAINATVTKINTLQTGVHGSAAELAHMQYSTQGMTSTAKASATVINDLETNLASLLTTQTAVTKNVNMLSQTLGVNKSAVLSAANALGVKLTDSFGTLLPKIRSYIVTAEMSHHPTKDAAAAFADLGNKANSVTTDIQNLDTAWADLVGNFLGAKAAVATADDSLVSLRQALKKSHDSLSTSTATGRAAIEQLQTTASSVSSAIDALYQKNGHWTSATLKAAKGLVDGLVATLPKGSAAAQQLQTRLDKYLKQLAGSMGPQGKQTGEDYWHGLLIGIENGLGPVGSAARNLAGQIDKNARQATGAASPSKKAIRVGQWYAQGLAIGLDSGGHMVYVSAMGVARQLAIGLTEGFTGESVKVKDSYSQAIQSMLSTVSAKIAAGLTKQQDQLKTFNQKLTSDLKARKQAISSLTGSIAGNADISNVLNQSLTVGSQTINFTGNIKSYLGGEASLLKREAHLFGRLRKMGLSPALLSQISGLAPSDAITVMQQILSGSDGSIRSLNALETSIRSSSKQIATGAVNTPGERHLLEKDRREIHQQTELLRRIDQHLAHFRSNPASHTSITLALKELDFTPHEIHKIMAGIRKAERNGVKL